METKKQMIKWIKTLLDDIDCAFLSDECGKYFYIMKSGQSYLVEYFVGKNGYGFANLNTLGVKTIMVIYNDLKKDFE